mmetsp:Transcript_43810/g.137088  ORF Transcript_43810/g.137088 Transcript_43810/m.137088 type:complete len:266 (-) Transcript_43810:1093-1890(-)
MDTLQSGWNWQNRNEYRVNQIENIPARGHRTSGPHPGTGAETRLRVVWVKHAPLPRAEHLEALAQHARKPVHVLGRVVERERGPHGTEGCVEGLVQGLSAVVASPDSAPVGIQEEGDVDGVHILLRVVEGHQRRTLPSLAGRRSVQAEPVHRRHGFPEALRELVLVGRDPVHADAKQVLARGTETHCLRYRGRARLEAGRHVRKGGTLQGHLLDHLPAPLPGRHLSQELLAPPKEADPGRPAHLVSRGRDPVGPEVLHVDGEVRH